MTALNFPSSPVDQQIYTFNNISYTYYSSINAWKKNFYYDYIAINDGSYLLPSLSFVNYLNTGLFSPEAYSIGFSNNGIESMRLSASGNLGVGTMSPSYKLDVSGTARITSNLIVGGDFIVNGTTTFFDIVNLQVKDKNIELGKVSVPSDITADGGGITLLGTTNKTFNWVDSTDSWTSSENIDLASGKVLKISGIEILSATQYVGNSASATNADLLDGQHGPYYAPISSPTFTGIPTASTAVADTNTTQLATTAFVIGQASSTNPSVLGSVAVGTSNRYARADHVHPTTGLGLTSGKLSQFAETTSAELAGVISDETGSGSLVFATSPSLTTPNIGAATGTSLYVSGSFNSGANGKGGLASKAYLQGASIANAVSHLTLDTLSAAQGERSGMSFYSTFQSTADNGSRRTADILAGFNGGAWGTEYLAFHVGLGGPANDAQSLTTERLRISKDSVLSTVPFIAPAATTSIPSIRLPHGTAPTAPTNGDMWTTTAGLYVQVNGTTVGPVGTGGGGFEGNLLLGGM